MAYGGARFAFGLIRGGCLALERRLKVVNDELVAAADAVPTVLQRLLALPGRRTRPPYQGLDQITRNYGHGKNSHTLLSLSLTPRGP